MGLWFGEMGSTLVAGSSGTPTGISGYIFSGGATGSDAQDQGQRTYAPRVARRFPLLTLSGKIKDEERATADELLDLAIEPKPKYRSECKDGLRPCPYVSCRYHLAVEINPLLGSVQMMFGAVDFDDMPDTCSLDVADRGDHSLEEVGEFMNRTKERVRQIETRALLATKAYQASPSCLDSTMASWMKFECD